MTASNYLSIIAIGLVFIGWDTGAYAEEDVTIYTSPSAMTNAVPMGALAPDGTPIIHKSLHKKKSSDTQAGIIPSTGASTPSTATSPTASVKSTPVVGATSSSSTVASHPAPPAKNSASFGPPVETGLPVARHSHDDPVASSTVAAAPAGTVVPGTAYKPATIAQHEPTVTPPAHSGGSPQLAMVSPLPTFTPTTTSGIPAPGGYKPKKSDGSIDELLVSTPTRKGPKNTYPWKTNIITTIFWIGEAGSTISPTNNVGSAWDEDWRKNNGGTDSPNDRSGYASGSHAARVNPFYVALPFNDLAFPDKAARWLPPGWHRPSKNGKQVSACKDRWVEIKVEDGSGRTCYAQWEDVGPLRYDHAEYVFGSQRPDTYTRAGLDVAPAVAQYLHIEGKDHVTTRWRFVDDEDVPPGVWLQYEEHAVLYNAILQEARRARSTPLPIQNSTSPIDDPSVIDSNKKKVGAAKG